MLSNIHCTYFIWILSDWLIISQVSVSICHNSNWNISIWSSLSSSSITSTDSIFLWWVTSEAMGRLPTFSKNSNWPQLSAICGSSAQGVSFAVSLAVSVRHLSQGLLLGLVSNIFNSSALNWPKPTSLSDDRFFLGNLLSVPLLWCACLPGAASLDMNNWSIWKNVNEELVDHIIQLR